MSKTMTNGGTHITTKVIKGDAIAIGSNATANKIIISESDVPKGEGKDHSFRKPEETITSVIPTHPLGLFISYAHEDDSLRRELEKHLSSLKRQGFLTIWSDRAIEAGQEWEKSISEQLKTAKIIVLLISPDFLSSEYIYEKELKCAMERHNASEARVIPVFLRPCHWKGEMFGKLQGIPDDAKSITQWSNQDEAFTAVVTAIREAGESLSSRVANHS